MATEQIHALLDPRVKNGDGKRKALQPGWRPAMIAWTGVTAAVLVINTSVLIWAYVRKPPKRLDPAPDFQDPTDTILLSQGSCSDASSLKLALHLAINILGALVLLASSNCMQCLASPSREELDKAHSNDSHLDIGILSLRNLFHVAKFRRFLWVLLSLSSVPLHLFYNSIFLFTVSAREIVSEAVSSDFVTAASYRNNTVSRILSVDNPDGALGSLFVAGSLGQSKASDYITAALDSTMPNSPGYNATRIELDTCLHIFSQRIVSNYSSVALVLSVSDPSQVLDFAVTRSFGYPQPWTCIDGTGDTHFAGTDELLVSCAELCSANNQYLSGCWAGNSQHNVNLQGPWEVQYCLAQPADEYCTVELAPSLLIVVIVMNIVKLIAMVCTVGFLNFKPIVTVGDAISSFLQRRDGPPATGENSRSVLSDGTGSSDISTIAGPSHGKLWSSKRKRCFSAVSKGRWIGTLGLCLLAELVAAFLLSTSLSRANFSESQRIGFGALDQAFFATIDGGIIQSVLLSNLPQLIVSTIYISYNSLIGTMLAVYDTCAFAVYRQTLRVSPPRLGQQRSTYWLSVPLRFAFPLLFAISALHFLISQSIFVVRVDVVQLVNTAQYGVLSGIGYSPIAIVAAISLGGVMILLPLVLGFRRLPSGIPIMGHNSRALAAACHADQLGSEYGGAGLPLMYGVLPTQESSGLKRVGFSSLPVQPLADGETYETVSNPWFPQRGFRPAPPAQVRAGLDGTRVPPKRQDVEGIHEVQDGSFEMRDLDGSRERLV